MIVAVVAERNPAAVRARLDDLARRFRPGRLLAEVRLDALDEPDPEVVAAAPIPVIVTCRRRIDGGGWRGTERDRLALLRAACAACPGLRFVDVEVDRLGDARFPGAPPILASLHDFAATPSGLEGVVARALAEGAAMVKLATNASDPADLLALRRAARSAPGRVVAFGLGPGGIASRLLFRRVGSPWVYARADSAAAGPLSGAPGLPALDDLVGLDFASTDLPEPEKVFGVLSDRPGHSIGPRVFNRWFRARGLPALYVPLQAPGTGQLRELMEALGIDGVSVTTPLKEEVLRRADHVDPLAARVGAANTVVRRGGNLLAFNTDVAGVRIPVAEAAGGGLSGASALVLGAGGAARAAVAALQDLGCRVSVTSRTPSRAEALARDLGIAVGWERGVPRILVNATPAGGRRDPEGDPASPEWIGPGQIVLEMNYGGEPTPLERRARARGATVIPGAAMYAAQAREQLVLFGCGPADPAELAEIVAWAMASS